MKRMISALAALVFAAGAAMSYAQSPAQTYTQTAMMYGMPSARLSIQNAAPWRCRIYTVAPGKHGKLGDGYLGDLLPGETMYAGKDKASWNPFAKPGVANYDLSSPLNIPIIALYVDDENHYIGAAWGSFNLPGGGMSVVESMIFTPQTIRFANDLNPAAAHTDRKQDVRAVHLPYLTADGANMIVFIWNSSTPAQIVVNGSNVDELVLGDMKAYVAWSPMNVTVTATAPDGRIVTWNQGFSNQQYYGTWNQVFVLGMNDLH